jgi:hypothetical protein
VRTVLGFAGLAFFAQASCFAAEPSQSLDNLFRMVLYLQRGDSKSAEKLVGNFPDPRPVLVRGGDGKLGKFLGDTKTPFSKFIIFPKGACRLIKLSPQSDKPDDPNAYDVFFDCNGEGKAMQVKLTPNKVNVIDFANIIVPPSNGLKR